MYNNFLNVDLLLSGSYAPDNVIIVIHVQDSEKFHCSYTCSCIIHDIYIHNDEHWIAYINLAHILYTR